MNNQSDITTHSNLLNNDVSLRRILENLPEFAPLGSLLCEASYYGASSEIARQLDLPYEQAHSGNWEHGWKPEVITIPPEVGDYTDKDFSCLVASENSATVLRNGGFFEVHEVGLPYLYAPDPNVGRIPNSLLVCPAHTSTFSKTNWSTFAEQYAVKIAELREDFATVLVCLSSNCIERGQWIQEFEAQGIPWIMGASIHDSNALRRMRSLFAHFEYMTTNHIGSHVVYANYEGCKTSIYNWQSIYTKDDFQTEPLYKKYPEIIANKPLKNRDFYYSKYPELFCNHPLNAKNRKDWAADQIGEPLKRPLAEIADLLVWNTRDKARIRKKRRIRKYAARLKRMFTRQRADL